MIDIDDLLRDCSVAGIIFFPARGRLRPQLTLGPVSIELRNRVENSAEQLRKFFAFAFDWPSDVGEIDYDCIATLRGTRVGENGTVRGLGRVGHPVLGSLVDGSKF